MTVLAISQIRADDRCQPRATFDTKLVEQYAEAMATGDTFPRIKIFFDGADYFLADGFHRYHAAKSLGLVDIEADVTEGTLRDAILFSCSANAAHGWRRTNDDKRRAVLRLLNDPEWQQWSDREIARQCGVDHKTVSNLRPAPSGETPQIERTVQRNGTTYTQNTAAINADRPKVERDFVGPLEIVVSPQQRSAWFENATPEAIAKFDQLNRETWSGNIGEIVRMMVLLPVAQEAAARFPALTLHTLNPDELKEVAAWFSTFAAEICKRKELANVAA